MPAADEIRASRSQQIGGSIAEPAKSTIPRCWSYRFSATQTCAGRWVVRTSLLMPYRLDLQPDEYCRGTSPTQAARWRPCLSSLASPTAATTAVAGSGPTPSIALILLRASELAITALTWRRSCRCEPQRISGARAAKARRVADFGHDQRLVDERTEGLDPGPVKPGISGDRLRHLRGEATGKHAQAPAALPVPSVLPEQPA